MNKADAGWQPIIYKSVICGHASPTRLGFVTDCNELATFIRATEYAHEYACNEHVAEMSADENSP